jgi:restriction system protein
VTAFEVNPTWDTYVVLVLRYLSDGETRSRREVVDQVAELAGLSDAQRAETLSSGHPRYENRIGWALTYLSKASAIVRPQRARYEISPIGRELLQNHPDGIGVEELRAIEGFAEAWQTGSRGPVAIAAPTIFAPELNPFEMVESGIGQINDAVAAELIQRMHGQNPAFFEQAVVDLLVAMGYGGVNSSAIRTQLSNDEGIDGIIDQDVLGLSRVYLQAKRYSPDKSIGRPDIQSFVGALQGKQANHGVFITTARFGPTAVDYVKSIPIRVALVDGRQLAELMIKFRVGVQVESTHHIVKVDEDFFE